MSENENENAPIDAAPIKSTLTNKPAELDPAKVAVDQPSNEVPRYKITREPHYIDGIYYEIGEVAPYKGEPGKFLEPVNEAARKNADKAKKLRAKRQAAHASYNRDLDEVNRLADEPPTPPGEDAENF